MTGDDHGNAGCLCGAVRMRVPDEEIWAAWCHCEDCRRATGAPAGAWIGYRASRVQWLGDAPRKYRSSAHGSRGFCGRCGSTISYEDDRLEDELYIAAGVLDNPEAVRPRAHAWDRSRLSWVVTDDGLPRLADYSRARPGGRAGDADGDQ